MSEPETKLASMAVQEMLADQATSKWLKSALSLALERDPVDALNDALALAGVLEEQLRRVMDLNDPV